MISTPGPLVIGLALLLWVLTQAAGAVAKEGTPEASPASGIIDCPVTTPVLADPPEPTQPAGMSRDPLGLSWWYVSDDGLLWTEAVPYRQTGGEKVLWLKPIGATLTVTGRRLDGNTPPLDADVPSGYGGDYQASAVFFPSAGCWEVTARADESELRFVTLVFDDGQAPRSGRP
jgi:hypothetical protein